MRFLPDVKGLTRSEETAVLCFDIRLHSTTDTGDEELGKAQSVGNWGSELLHPRPLPATVPTPPLPPA